MNVSVVCSAAKVFVIMLSLQMVNSQLPSDQVSAMASVYEIIQNNTANSFVWNDVLNSSNPCTWEGVGCTSDNSSINTICVQFFSISTSEFLPFLCNISTLESLDVSENQLSSIPHTFFTNCRGISGLKILNFCGNSLIGTLPTFNAFAMLEHLDFSRNSFSGEIGLQLDELGSLKSLDLGRNHFSGKIPSNLGKMNLLDNLVLSANLFSGEIPIEITKFKNLTLIDLSSNRLSGSVPREFGELTKLQTLVLSSNSLSGEIPMSISNITTLERFAANQNMFNGTIPLGITSFLSFLDLSYNSLSGIIPSDLLSGSNLQALDLSFNKLEGPVPSIISKSLLRLRLGSNSLSGTIPSDSLDSDLDLTYLELDNNRLGGEIPPELGKCKNLSLLNLAHNSLRGSLPRVLSNLINLQVLSLEHNYFVGGIPATLSKLERLTVLDLSNNRLSGNVPFELSRLNRLTHLLLSNNQLSGYVPKYGYNVVVDIRGNNNLIDPRIGSRYISGERTYILSPQRKTKPIDTGLVIAVASGFPVGLVISAIAIFISRKYKSIHGYLCTPSRAHSSSIDFKKAMEAVADPSNITLEARSSTFYKAVMPSGSTYLAKKINHRHNMFRFPRHMQLVEELEVFGNLSHPNVMIPLAYVLTVHRSYLFYGFVRGTLHDILHRTKGNTAVDWASRCSIAVGVAKGLAYLHECSSGPVLLLDLSTKSIFLKSIDEPQISDVELCSLIQHPSRATGTKYGCTKSMTAAGNVYSYGVLLLELLTGKPALIISTEGTELAKWALTFSEQKSQRDQILDSSMCEAETSIAVRNQMFGVLEVALACVSNSPEMRPNMVNVVQMLLNTTSN